MAGLSLRLSAANTTILARTLKMPEKENIGKKNARKLLAKG